MKALFTLLFLLPLLAFAQNPSLGQEGGNAGISESQVRTVEASHFSKKDLRKSIFSYGKGLKSVLKTVKSSPPSPQFRNGVQMWGWIFILIGVLCLLALVALLIWAPWSIEFVGTWLASGIFGGILGGIFILWIEAAWRNDKIRWPWNSF